MTPSASVAGYLLATLLFSSSSAWPSDDEAALAQASVRLHRDPVDGHEVAQHMKEMINAALAAKGIKTDADAPSSLNVGRALSGAMDAALGGQSSAEVSLSSTEQGTETELDYTHGFHLHRSVAFVEEGSVLKMEVDHGCSETDDFGSNNCTLHANERFHVRLHYRLSRPIGEGAVWNLNVKTRLVGLSAVVGQKLAGKKIKGFQTTLPNITGECALCGRDCEMDVFGTKVSQKMPPCPIRAGEDFVMLDASFKMPRTSGVKLAQSKVTGALTIKREDGTFLARAEGKLRIGKLEEAPCPQIKQYLNLCEELF